MSLIDFAFTSRVGRVAKLQSGDRLDEFGTTRICAAGACGARLSRYNPGSTCSLHGGWRNLRQPRRLHR